MDAIAGRGEYTVRPPPIDIGAMYSQETPQELSTIVGRPEGQPRREETGDSTAATVPEGAAELAQPTVTAIEVPPAAPENDVVSSEVTVEFHSTRDAISYLFNSNADTARRADEMNQEQMNRLESYAELGSPPKLFFMPSVIGKGLDTVSDAVQSVIPAPITNVANAVGDELTKVADIAANVINSAPTLLMSTIPSNLMSARTKQLIFVDFNNTLRSFFHTNVLAMPYVFHQTGVVMGMVIMVLVSIACEYATELFLLAKYALPDPSKVNGYGDVPRLTFGDWYPTFNIFYGVIHLIGFQVFAAKNSQVMFRTIFGVTDNVYAYRIGMIVPSAIAVPLIFMKSAHNQRPLSIVSNTLVFISVIVLLFAFPYDAFDVSVGPSTVSNLGVALGIVVYAFTGIGSVIPVERTMPARRYKSLLRPAVAMAFLLLVLFGISGYVSFGGSTCAVITMSLAEGPTKGAVAVMLFIASIAIIPQQIFPFAEVMDRRLLGLTKLPTYFQLSANVYRIGATVGCAFVAYFVPYYGLLSAISGAIGCSVMGFLVPGLLERSRRSRRNPSLRWWEHALVFSMVGFSIFILIACTTASVYQLFNIDEKDYEVKCY